MHFSTLPDARAAGAPDAPALRDDHVALTNAELLAAVRRVAASLARRGIGRGDVVAVMLPNRVELLIGLMAAWRLGAAATPINPVFTANEASYQIDDSQAALLLTATAAVDYGLPIVLADDLPTMPEDTLPEPRVGLDDLALLIYTSGSTGRPKGVMLDHANLVAMASAIVEAMGIRRDDHCLLVLPLFHVNAICVSFLSPMLAGGQLSVEMPSGQRPPAEGIEVAAIWPVEDTLVFPREAP